MRAPFLDRYRRRRRPQRVKELHSPTFVPFVPDVSDAPMHSLVAAMAREHEGAHVWIRFEHDPFGGSYVCGDEDGEFARTSSWPLLIPYVEELVLVAGNVRDGGLAEAHGR